jgi:hypothetical protein
LLSTRIAYTNVWRIGPLATISREDVVAFITPGDLTEKLRRVLADPDAEFYVSVADLV